MSAVAPEPRDSSTDRLPHKPTRDSVAGTRDPAQVTGQAMSPAGEQVSEELTTGREEVGGEVSSSRNPPHVTANDESAEMQDELPSPDPVPVLPANAGGSDAATVDEQSEPIDEASMYDRRPERDKDRPPSDRVDE